MSAVSRFHQSDFGQSDFRMLVLISAWATFQFWILGKYSLTITGDELDSVFSVLMGLKADESLRPLWYRFAAAGSDQLAVGYAPPLDLLGMKALPGWVFYQLRHVVQVTAGLVAVFYLCRRNLAMPRPGALFAAFVAGQWFSLANFYASAICLMPLLILALSILLEDRRSALRWIFALAVIALYSGTAHIQFLVGFPMIVITVWFVVLERRYDPVSLLILALVFVLLVLPRTEDILALLSNAPYSQRANWAHYNPPFLAALWEGTSRVLTSFDPRIVGFERHVLFSISSVAGYFTLYGLWMGRKNRAVRAFALLFVATVLCEIGLPVFKFLVYDVLPPIRGFSINKFWMMAAFILQIGAGIGFQALYDWSRSRGTAPRRKAPMVAVGLVFVLALAYRMSFAAFEWVSQGNYVLQYESPVIEDLAERIEASGEPARVAGYQIYDSVLQGYGLETSGGLLVLYAKRYSDFWNKIYEKSLGIDPEVDLKREQASQTMIFGMVYGVEDKQPRRAFGDRFDLDLLSLQNVRYVLSRDELTDPQFKQLNAPESGIPWSALGTRDKVLTNAKANFTGRTHLYVYENTQALPRWFFAGGVEVAGDLADLLDKAGERPVAELRETVLLTEVDAGAMSDPGERFATTGTISNEVYESDRLVLKTDAAEPRLLVVSNAYSPYWKVTVNGDEAPLLAAHGAFWAVRLPAGENEVVFEYWPPYRLF